MSERSIDWSVVHPVVGFDAANAAFREAEKTLDEYVDRYQTAPTNELSDAFNAAQTALQAVCPHLVMRRVGHISQLQNRYRCDTCMGEAHVS